MSRKRSEEAIQAHRERFVEGAGALGRRRRGGRRAGLQMIEGFSGFGFPKAHGAAFGLLAYQSTWLRVHYGPEFLCALLNEQPMGFYPPDRLVHEAQRRGIAVLPPDVNAAPPADSSRRRAACGSGSGTSRVCRPPRWGRSSPSASAAGPFRSLRTSPRAPARGAARSSSWPGRALRRIAAGGGARGRPLRPARGAVAAGGRRAAACGAARAPSSRCRSSCRWRRPALAGALAAADRRLRDERADDRGAPDGDAAARARRRAGPRPAPSSGGSPTDGAFAVGGLVVARQRPGTAERGLLHAARGRVRDGQPGRAAAVYERHRARGPRRAAAARRGRLERSAGGGA